MKRSLLSLTIIAGLGLAACSGNDKPEKDTSIMPATGASSINTAPVVAGDTTLPVQFSTGAVDQKVINSSQTISASQAATVAPTAGLNPAHGQPGHRCEIAVGAPLNSAPTATTATPQVQTINAPVAAPANIPAMGGNGTARLNPAHGEPGHDCAVQVGAPLKN